MRPITARETGTILAAFVIIALTGTAGAQSSGGPGGVAGIRPPVSWTTPDGTLQLTPAAGWEANPRLASDNGVIAMIHPSGMQKDQTLPAWLLIDRRTRDPKIPFSSVIRACLTEGRTFAYFPADSAMLTTADGHALATYRFNLGPDGSDRGLGLLEAPTGTILFRYETVSAQVWKDQQAAMESMLRSVRFLPNAK